MPLTDDHIDAFIQLTRRIYGRELSRGEAREITTRLMICLERIAQEPPVAPQDLVDSPEARYRGSTAPPPTPPA